MCRRKAFAPFLQLKAKLSTLGHRLGCIDQKVPEDLFHLIRIDHGLDAVVGVRADDADIFVILGGVDKKFKRFLQNASELSRSVYSFSGVAQKAGNP